MRVGRAQYLLCPIGKQSRIGSPAEGNHHMAEATKFAIEQLEFLVERGDNLVNHCTMFALPTPHSNPELKYHRYRVVQRSEHPGVKRTAR
jgi:hypothetical protein